MSAIESSAKKTTMQWCHRFKILESEFNWKLDYEMSLFQLWIDETSFSVQWIWSWNKISLGFWVKSSGEFGKARRVSRYIVKRIFLKWDGLWHFVSVSKLFQIYNLTQNAEYGNYKFYFLKPPSLQGRECFTANLSSLEKDLNKIEHIKICLI